MSKEGPTLVDFTVLIEDRKHEYLITVKDGKLTLAGLGRMSRGELEDAIRFKMRSSYLYSLDWRDVPETTESAGYRGSYFNIMLEFPREDGDPERVTVALEFMPADKVLRVVTMT
ncbi:hypothetical protein [Alcaligenes faecalis]|uniref:hypothetical protein n=1 Tax=Alcaligenes faecalis TaxID=511 RepID=UPI000F0B2941|nr:hypothetical protein [Alcaligenes faecalis]AYR19105.1 hypothetical protein D6I95_01205 [Alcaligenes faecalis]